MRSIYLDYNSTTPLAGAVRQAINPFLDDLHAVPGNPHWQSRAVEEAIEDARNQVAIMLNCTAPEVVFTSGGTESNNLALLGYGLELLRRSGKRSHPHFVLSAIEHASVAKVATQLERLGWSITRIPVRSDGRVDPDDLASAITKQTRLISIQLANGEIGVIQDVHQLARVSRPKSCLFHTDATQAFGKMEVDVATLNVDLLSLSGHKMYAPKGIGVLYVRAGVLLEPLMRGGWEEGGLRPGQLNIASLVGLGVASQLVKAAGEDGADRLSRLSQQFMNHLDEESDRPFTIHGDAGCRLPNTLSIVLPGVMALPLVQRLPELHLGLAMPYPFPNETSYRDSPWQGLGISFEDACATIRFSAGWNTTDDEVVTAARLLAEAYRAAAS